MADDRIRRGVLRRFAAFRDRLLERVRGANQESETAVLEIGTALNGLVDIARSQADRIETLRRHADEQNEHGLTAAVAVQIRQVADYSNDLGALITQQNGDARAALEQLESIARAAYEIQRLVNASRMLALNAQVEAARMGEAGRAFAVVAAEMKTFAQEMARANSSVSSMVSALRSALPRMAERAGTMDERARQFSHDFEGSVGIIQVLTGQMQSSIAEILDHGSTTMTEVLKKSEEGLSALQFQDPQAQALLFIDRLAHDEQVALARTLEITDEKARPSAQQNLGSEANFRAQNSGEVTLF